MGQALSDAFANTGRRISLRIGEDCLYLNIYVPAQADKAEQLTVSDFLVSGFDLVPQPKVKSSSIQYCLLILHLNLL